MTDSAARIVFIGGYARTGSTLLDRMLGEIEGLASFGEIRHIWERSFLGNQLCGCGRRFRECPFWQEVVAEAFGGFEGVDARSIHRLKEEVDAFANIPRMAAGAWTPGYARRLSAYTAPLARLYSSMQRVSGARFLVDSTKDPQHAYVLRSIPRFDVRVVHLVRDSRPVAHSWRRVRSRPEVFWEPRDMPRFSPVRTAMAWNLANVAAGATRLLGLPYILVRYEDLVRDPRAELQRIAELLDLGPVDLDFLDGHTARLGPSHTVAGNPMRFERGSIEIRADEEWRRAMRPRDRAVVTMVTWPLLARYRYRQPVGPTPVEMWRAVRLVPAHRRDPLPYGRVVAGLTLRYLRSLGVSVEGSRWLDVGTGAGALTEALRRSGATAVGLDVADRRAEGVLVTPFVAGTGEGLPFRDASFDGVVCSNVLEHVRDPWDLIGELLRVCRPGGVVYLSWTNWYSPFGGHDWSPFHYLGTQVGLRAYRKLTGRTPLQVPGRTLFPVHVGQVLRGLRRRGIPIVDMAPRYWPAWRFLARIPGLREVALWNCVVVMRRP